MDPQTIAVVLIAAAVLTFGVAIVAIVGVVALLMLRKKPAAQVSPPMPAATASRAQSPSADPSASPLDAVRPPGGDDDEEEESGATEVFTRDSHGRLMGWEEDDDEAEDNSGATELFSREQLKGELAGLMDDEDPPEDYSIDDDDDDGLPGKVVAE